MIAAVLENPFQRCCVFEQGRAAGDIRGQPAVFIVGRNPLAQQSPRSTCTHAKPLRLEEFERLGRQQILDGQNLCDVA